MYRLPLVFLLTILVNHLSYADQAVSFDESLKQIQTNVVNQAQQEINISKEEALVQQATDAATRPDKAPSNTTQAPMQQPPAGTNNAAVENQATATNNSNPWIRPNPWAETAKVNPWANRPLPSSSAQNTNSSANATASSNTSDALPSPPNIFAPPSANSTTQQASSNSSNK